MFDVFKQFATDPTAEEKGRGFTKEFGGAVRLYIARSGNRNYTSQTQAEWKANAHTLEKGQAEHATPEEKSVAEALSFKIVGRVMARTVLLGWDLVETIVTEVDGKEVIETKITDNSIGYNGAILPYSIENAELLLSHKEFRDRVARVSNDYEKFLFEQEEADAKNSVPTSTGISSGVAASNIS